MKLQETIQTHNSCLIQDLTNITNHKFTDNNSENPYVLSILIQTMCKEKHNKTVEYSFRDFSKPMGVSTFKTSDTLPPELQKALPDAETLKRLMDDE